MTGHPWPCCADQRWVQEVLTNLQHQIDDLHDQLQALAHLVHNHTVAALDTATSPVPAPARPLDGDDG